MASRTRVVLLAFDGLPLRLLRPSLTPNLWRLGQEGGHSPEGGRSGLPSTTYPGFAALLTGGTPSATGIRTTARRDGAVPGWAGSDRCRLPTILHVAQQAGLSVAGVMGDQKLEIVLGLDEIDTVWPPRGNLPTGIEVDAHGYPTNAALLDRILAAAANPDLDLLFVHLNETDTIAHDTGPASAATQDCVRAADAIAGRLIEALDPFWNDALILVASDHDMTTRLPLPPIDPTEGPDCEGLVADWIADGCAAWVRLTDGADHHLAIDRLAAIEGVERWRWREPDVMLLLAAVGRTFAAPWIPRMGIHGSTATARTLALVGGGHPAVAPIAAALADHSPRLVDWAPTIASVLGLDLPEAEGKDLVEAGGLRSVV